MKIRRKPIEYNIYEAQRYEKGFDLEDGVDDKGPYIIAGSFDIYTGQDFTHKEYPELGDMIIKLRNGTRKVIKRNVFLSYYEVVEW